MAEITEEKALGLKAHFIELGTRIGKETGTKAGEAAGKDIDLTLPIKEAQEAARPVTISYIREKNLNKWYLVFATDFIVSIFSF